MIHINSDKIERVCIERSIIFERNTSSKGLERLRDTIVIIPDKEGGRIVINILKSTTSVCIREVFYEDLLLDTDEICTIIKDWDSISPEQAKHYFDWYFED